MEEERLYDVYALDEDIKILEKFIKEIETENPLDSYFDEEAKAIEHLIEAYRKVKEELESVKEIYYTQKEIEEDYIPKSKIKEKIEDLNIKMAEQLKIISEFGEHEKNRAKLTMYKEQRDILAELLEEE